MSRYKILIAAVLFFAPLSAAADICPSLSVGSRGASVTAMQQIFYSAYQGFPAPTGYFGSVTQAALKQWQTEHGIEATGTVGPKTAAAMKLCSANVGASALTTKTVSYQSAATTTFANGINLTGGCFAISGKCISFGSVLSTAVVPETSGGGGSGTVFSKVLSYLNPATAASASFQCPVPKAVACTTSQLLVPGVVDSNGCKLQDQCIDLPASLASPAIPAAAVALEGSPSNENQEGKVWSWVPSLQRLDLRVPKIFFGPGALDVSTGNIPLASNTWVKLTSGIPGDGIGFRAGLVGYLPKGRYGVYGQVAIATPSVNKTYYVRIREGRSESSASQPRIATGNPVTVGGGIATSPQVANVPFTIPFMASDIQYNGASGHAAEVWVEVYAEDASDGAGAALAATGQAENATISALTFIRWDGLYGSN